MKNTCRKAIAIILAIFVVFAAATPFDAGAFAVFAEADTVESDAGSAAVEAEAVEVDAGEAVTDAGSAELDAAKAGTDAGSAEVEAGAAEVGALAETAAEAAEDPGKGAEAESADPDSGAAEEDADADADYSAKDPADVTLAYEGKDYDITLTGGSKTGLTEDTALDAREIPDKGGKDGGKYEEYMSLTETALGTEETGRKIRFVKFYDITLTDADGQDMEPSAPVDVSIKFDKKLASTLETSGDGELSVIHFTEDADSGKIDAEVIGTDSGSGEEAIEVSAEGDKLSEVSFTAGSFSVYAVVYTVDFHYGDGEYDFSIAGESSILLSEVFERLHIDDIDVADIDEVTFSDPSLIKVEKAEGAESDWLLTSLAPFDTEETLTITLTDGSVTTIKVTDAAPAEEFVPINSNDEITSVVGSTNFPVYYYFGNGAIVSGDDIGMPTRLRSQRISSPNEVVAAGADKTAFQSAWNSALGTNNVNVTVNRAWAENNTLQIQLAFTAANGNVYYSSQYGTTNSANNTNLVRNEINTNRYMLVGDDKIVVRLDLQNNPNASYSENGIAYGTITNSTVRATATELDADTYGSNMLPATVSIAGVPYTVIDGITKFKEDGITYTLNSNGTAYTIAADDGVDLPETGYEINVNGRTYEVTYYAATTADLVNNTRKVPVRYEFANGEVVSGLDINMTDDISSGAVNSAANTIARGVNVSALQSSLNNAFNITNLSVTVPAANAFIRNKTTGAETHINYAFKAANGHVYYTTTAYLDATDGNKTTLINEVNNNQFILKDDEEVVIKLTMNRTPSYTTDWAEFSIDNGAVTATATYLDADSYGSNTLPSKIYIAGVPYTVADNITRFKQNGVTYKLNTDRTAFTEAVEEGVSLPSLGYTFDVNGTTYTVSYYSVTVDDVTNNTRTVPVRYEFDNSEVVSGSDISVTDTIVSGEVNTAANLTARGVDVSALNSNLNTSFGINNVSFATNNVYVRNKVTTKETHVYYVFRAGNGKIYYATSAQYDGNDAQKEALINHVNNGKYILKDDEEIVVKLHSATNRTPTYTDDGLTYQMSTSKVTATLNLSTYPDAVLKDFVVVDGVPFKLSLETNNSGYTYKGVTYRFQGNEEHISGYRAATIGAGVNRIIRYNAGYGQTTQGITLDSVESDIALSKTIRSNKTVEEVRSLIGDDEFVFDITPDPSNPENGAELSLNSGGSGTEVTVSADDILTDGQNISDAATDITYTLDGNDSPWHVVFTKEGTYSFTVNEPETGRTNNGIEYDIESKTVTYYVSDYDGVLHISECLVENDSDIYATQSQTRLDPIDLGRLFYTSADNGVPTIEEANSVIEMKVPGNCSGVITTQFTFDFSRDFELSGQMMVPSSDAISFAFHYNRTKPAYRWYCNNALDDLAYWAESNYTPELLRYGYLPHDADMMQGFIFNIMSRDVNNTRGWYAYKVENNVRMPYRASSGLNGDVKNFNNNYVPNETSYETFLAEEDNNWTTFKIIFDCTDHECGKGKLTIVSMGKTVEFDDFNASDILGEDTWQHAYFSLGACVQSGFGGLRFIDEEYKEKIDSVDVSFWADRNQDGFYETQVNSSNSPAIPGETILARHKIRRDDNLDYKYYENVLVRQLEDTTTGTKLVPTDLASYPEGSPSSAILPENSDDAFNIDDVAKAMKVAVFSNEHDTIFEYKITAPNEPDHTVVESALYGQPPFDHIYTDAYSFRTENIKAANPEFINRASIKVLTYDPDGGVFGDNSTSSKTINVLKGDSVTVSETPTKQNKAFAGWKSDIDNRTYRAGDTITINEDTVLTAQWSDSAALTITKEATGDYADLTRDYTFTISLPEKAGGYTATKYASSSDTTGTDITTIGDTGGDFSLRTGERIVIEEISINREISVTETNIGTGSATGEDGHYKVTPAFIVGTAGTNYKDLSISGTTATFKLMNDATLGFGNYLNGVVPSGIMQGPKIALMFAFMLLSAVLVRLIFAIRRRKAMTRG